MKAVNDDDRQILLRPGFESAFCDASAECFAQGSEGLVRDSECLYRAWAFDVSEDRTAGSHVAGTGLIRWLRRSSTRPSPSGCPVRSGIRSTAPGIL